MKRTTLAIIAGAMTIASVLSGCGSESPDTTEAVAETTAVETTTSRDTSSGTATAMDSSPSAPADMAVTASGISAARCDANKKAGTITYLSGFDFAATTSIIEVMVAKEAGYFEAMCLDVDVKASFSTANYALVTDNKAQFASAGSYTELLQQTPTPGALVMVYNLGKTAIDALMVKDETVTDLSAMKGTTIGVKGALPPSITAMLAKAGLSESDYTTVAVEGFNPVTHFQLPIDALPGHKSNEPGQLDRAGVAYKLFDPAAFDISGSFGIVYTNATFLREHPTAAQDFVRAALKGFEDATANPAAAIALAVTNINGNGNPNFLSADGEAFRWNTEAKIVADNTPEGTAPGQIIPGLLQAQVDTYTAVGVFAEKPDITGSYDETLVEGVMDGSQRVIWPIGG